MSLVDDKLTDISAERIVLAGVAQSGDAFLDVDFLLRSSTFVDKTNQIIWSCIKSLRDENSNIIIDLTLLRSKARELNLDHLIEDPKELEYIKNLLFFNVEISNVNKFAAIIRKFEIARLLHNQMDYVQSDLLKIRGSESIDQIIGIAENRFFDFSNSLLDKSEKGVIHISDGADDYFEYLCENVTDLIGISTGFPILDDILGGLRRQTVNIIGARTGIGKSMLADNVALHVAGKLNIPVLYLDTEMSQKGHLDRMWANISDVKIKFISNGKFSKNELQKRLVKNAKDYINSIPYYYVDISGKQFEETLSYIRRWLLKHVGYDENGNLNNCLIIYDYLKMMSGAGISSEMKEFQILGFQMTSLHNFAVKFDVPILSFVQLNRDGINKDSTDTVSQSDRIVWLTSSLAIYKPKSPDELSDTINEGNMKLIVVKNRYGPTNSDGEYINIHADGSVAKIKEGKLSSNVSPPPPKDDNGDNEKRKKPKFDK